MDDSYSLDLFVGVSLEDLLQFLLIGTITPAAFHHLHFQAQALYSHSKVVLRLRSSLTLSITMICEDGRDLHVKRPSIRIADPSSMHSCTEYVKLLDARG